MGLILDSTLLIAAEREEKPLAELLGDDLATETVAISAVTASELLHGIHRAATAKQRGRRESFVERLLAGIPVLPFDLVTARAHARLSADLVAKGTPIGAHDLLIGATAITHGSTIVTRDLKSFPRIPGLSTLKR